VVERREWLAERRAAVAADYTRDAATYDDYPISDIHRAFVKRVVATCPPGGLILDIPCGTGRYFELVVEDGRRVVGVDQSSGMVRRARQLGLAQRVEESGLQELASDDEFDGVLCIDAMEHIPPEEWPIVLGNLARALRPSGLLYMTVEILRDQELEVERAYADAIAAGAPAVRGEDVGDETGGYHFYADPEQISKWMVEAGLELIDDTSELTYGDWGYRHLLLRHGSQTGA
jgi:2-polyprenyl-3-methyl-5-hydroxy-6-metoxy-1,4-benzoquinol methylase